MPSGRDRIIDVAVLGAGPAGCAAAIGLARRGYRVRVIEKKAFPRPKTCGGCLSGRAMRYLVDLVGSADAVGGVPVTAITFAIGRHRLRWSGAGSTRVVRRADFDARLAAAARTAGAEISFGQAGELVREADRWAVRAGDEMLRPRWVFAATGLDRQVLGAVGAVPAGGLVGQSWVQVRAKEMPAPGQVEMHWLRGGYVGIAPLDAENTIVALAAPAHAEGEPILRTLRRRNPDAPLWRSITEADVRRSAVTGAADFPWTPRRVADANLLFVGDAAGYLEPFSGEGIGQALCSAACAVEALALDGQVAADYGRLLAARHRPAGRRLALLGRVLRHPVVLAAAEWTPLLPSRLLAGLIGRMHVRDEVAPS